MGQDSKTSAKPRIVLKVGGSLLFDKDLQIRLEPMRKFAETLQKSSNIVATVVGGGKLARTYINAAHPFDASEAMCDTFGIEVSRLNARLIIAALGETAYPEPIKSILEAREKLLFNRILVAGGFVPGQSTTSVTFEIAEALKATHVVILTNVDGIYNKDPNKYLDATKFDEMTIAKLEEVIYGEGGDSQAAAGEYRILDAVSLQILKRSNLSVRLANGEKFEDLHKLLVEERFDLPIGTKIVR